MRLILGVLLSVVPLYPATELEVRYSLLERVLAGQVFTQEGRLYVRGSKATPCNYASLEKPQIRSEQGRLSIRTRYSGRRSVDLFGRCVGLGGSFLANITAVPYHRDGKLGLREVTVTALDTAPTFYIRRVCRALAASIERDFSVELLPAARRLLEQTSSAYQISVNALAVKNIEIRDTALLITLDLLLSAQ